MSLNSLAKISSSKPTRFVKFNCKFSISSLVLGTMFFFGNSGIYFGYPLIFYKSFYLSVGASSCDVFYFSFLDCKEVYFLSSVYVYGVVLSIKFAVVDVFFLNYMLVAPFLSSFISSLFSFAKLLEGI